MANKKPKQNKPKTGLARCLELASNKKGLVFLSAILSSLAAIASFVPYIAVYFIISSILKVYPNLELLDMSKVMNYGWIALAGIIANILLYFLAIFSSHMAAFGTLYELKLHFAEHITKIPLGYHLTIGSGRLRKIMDENIESIEGFIAHQFPDFVASVTAPIVMVIILLAIDWRFGIASLVGIVLAFVVQFSGFGSGAMKENMGKYQIALEDMNNASPIIVLDEATAFSDPENEYLIQKAFEKLMQNKTVIIIAHRLSTIRNADKIIVMEKGHLVEEGKHNELVAAGGRYSQMWNHYTEAVDWKISGKAV